MANCCNCKTMLSDTDVFCSVCGSKVGNSQTTTDKMTSYKPKFVKLEAQKSSKSKKPLVIAGLICLISLIVIGGGYFFTTKENKNAVNLEKFIEIAYEGYDGRGYIVSDYPKFDIKGLEEDIKEKMLEQNLGYPQNGFRITDLTDNIKIDVYKDGNLHDGKKLNNHDKLTLKLTYDINKLKKVLPEIDFAGTEKNVTVELIPLEAINPFKNYVPKFEGISPVGHLKQHSRLDSSDNEFISEAISKHGFPFTLTLNGKELTYDDNIAVGDVISITLNEAGLMTLDDMGATVSKNKTSKKYKVSLADFDKGAYVTVLSDIQDSVNEEINETVDKAAQAYLAKQNTTAPIKFEGRAFAKVKEGVSWNKLFYENFPHLIYVYSFESERFGTPSTHYIIISGIAVTEQVENHGKVDVLKNPGETIQTFARNSEDYSKTYEYSVDDVKIYFTKQVDQYDFDMDESLRNLIAWSE